MVKSVNTEEICKATIKFQTNDENIGTVKFCQFVDPQQEFIWKDGLFLRGFTVLLCFLLSELNLVLEIRTPVTVLAKFHFNEECCDCFMDGKIIATGYIKLLNADAIVCFKRLKFSTFCVRF